MNTKTKILLLVISLLVGICLGFVGYVAVTGAGIAYSDGVYDRHLNGVQISTDEKQRFMEDYNFVCREIENNYVNLKYKEEKFGFKWPDLCEKYRKELEQAKSEKDFYITMSALLYHLHDGHMVFRYSNIQTAGKLINVESSAFMECMDIRYIENCPVVVRAADENLIGCEVLTIEGIPFETIMAKMTNTFEFSENDISARTSALINKYYFRYFYYFADQYPNMLHIMLKDRSGKTRPLEIDVHANYDAVPIKGKSEINFGFDEPDALPSCRIIGDIGYIKIPSFNARYSEVVNAFKSTVQNLKQSGVKGAVIDIRNNTGGNESFRDILGYLASEEMLVNKYRYRKSQRFGELFYFREFYDDFRSPSYTGQIENGYTKWWSWKVNPSDEGFLRSIPVAVVVNESVFSSADEFANVCLNNKLAKVVGNIVPLSGYGLATYVALPSRNYEIRYAFHEGRGPDYAYTENVVKQPDIFSEQTLADFDNGVDSQLEAALDYVKNVDFH